ncbi:MAG: hypothetical protein HRU09_13510 [Oligoflexales bacterium]|nr:hypothetical protein [Oligoflexales bacterium]
MTVNKWPAIFIVSLSFQDLAFLSPRWFGGVMRRSGVAKFPNSVQLFKFCQKVLMDQKGAKVHDQEVGGILNFNPSDCSHWKRGEKNVKSVFALAKLADVLGLEVSLVHDIASGHSRLEEAYYEYKEGQTYHATIKKALEGGIEGLNKARTMVEAFVNSLHDKAEFSTPPLYLPEILRFFPFITIQPIEMMDKLSRILRKKPGQYTIHFRKGELKPQTRMSMAKDIARIIFEGERQRFPELGPQKDHLVAFEEMVFTANLLAPKSMLIEEMSKMDSRRNMISELSAMFWVPKSLIGFQLQDTVRSGQKVFMSIEADKALDSVWSETKFMPL